MLKEFKITLDIKKESISNKINGLNLNDEASIKIKFVQNSLPYVINNKDIRIDYKLPDGVLLFQNENTGVAKVDGNTIDIQVINQALQQVGDVTLDVSIFEKSTSKKITTSKLILKVDSIIYKEEQLSTDFDALQTALNDSKKLESKFGTAKDLDNKLQQDFKTGTALDNTLKEDIKNADTSKSNLDGSITKANNTKNVLESTIATGDKLKQELTPSNYVKNADYEAYKKEANSQYEDTTNKLNNFGGRNYLMNSNFRRKETGWITYKNGEGCTIKFNDGNVVINNVSRNFYGIYQSIKDICIQKSQKYIISFYAKADKDLNILCGWTSHGVNCRVRESNDYIRYSISIGNPQNDNEDTIIVYNATQNSNVEITKIQVECGDVVSDWNLAPEEVIANSYRLDAIEKILINKGYMKATQNL